MKKLDVLRLTWCRHKYIGSISHHTISWWIDNDFFILRSAKMRPSGRKFNICVLFVLIGTAILLLLDFRTDSIAGVSKSTIKPRFVNAMPYSSSIGKWIVGHQGKSNSGELFSIEISQACFSNQLSLALCDVFDISHCPPNFALSSSSPHANVSLTPDTKAQCGSLIHRSFFLFLSLPFSHFFSFVSPVFSSSSGHLSTHSIEQSENARWQLKTGNRF